MLRRSNFYFQFGKRAPPGSTNQTHFNPKRQFRDDHRAMELGKNNNLNHHRPAPAWKLPQLVNINKACPAGLGGSAIVKSSSSNSSSYSFDGFKLIGSAFKAHRQIQLRKEQQIAANSDKEDSTAAVDYIFHDQHCMVIPDAYPKSTFHFLILPRMSTYPHLNAIADVTEKDVKLLRHMDSVSAEIVKAIFGCSEEVPSLARRRNISDEDEVLEKILGVSRKNDANEKENSSSSSVSTDVKLSDKDYLRDWLFRPRSIVSHLHPVSKLRFMSGCHVLPSLCPLHMHLTSLDMQSDALKNKKHYNTFTTGFFVSRARVEEEILKHRFVKLANDHEELEVAEKLENQSPMLCAWCQFQCKNMPELKKHLMECKSNGCYFVQNTTIASR